MADYIPFAIQSEIMKRLPTKSLMRFRSVSKPWKSLIDSPKFIADYSFDRQHLLVTYVTEEYYEKQKYFTIVDDDTFPLTKVSLPDPIPKPIIPRIVLLGSSQGLFCLYNVIRCNGWTVHKVHLWNPSIRKSVAIDVSPVQVPNSHIDIGFGVCPHTSDPKLVKINYSDIVSEGGYTISYSPWQVEVYSLSSRSWRSIPTINQPRKSIRLLRKHVVLNEFIYWLAIDDVGTHEYNALVSYDLTSEEFMELSLPGPLTRPYSRMVISKLKESLVVVEVDNEVGTRIYGVWTMDEGASNSFVKLFTINIPDLSLQALLGFWKNNEPIFLMGTDYGLDHHFVQDVDDFVLHSGDIGYIGISQNGFSHFAHSYTETLLLLDH